MVGNLRLLVITRLSLFSQQALVRINFSCVRNSITLKKGLLYHFAVSRNSFLPQNAKAFSITIHTIQLQLPKDILE